jgi:hypothetical protein
MSGKDLVTLTAAPSQLSRTVACDPSRFSLIR